MSVSSKASAASMAFSRRMNSSGGTESYLGPRLKIATWQGKLILCPCSLFFRTEICGSAFQQERPWREKYPGHYWSTKLAGRVSTATSSSGSLRSPISATARRGKYPHEPATSPAKPLFPAVPDCRQRPRGCWSGRRRVETSRPHRPTGIAPLDTLSLEGP